MTNEQEQLEFDLGIKAPPPADREVRITAAGTPSGVHRTYTGRNAQLSLRLTAAMIRRFRGLAVAEGLQFNAMFAKLLIEYVDRHDGGKGEAGRQ